MRLSERGRGRMGVYGMCGVILSFIFKALTDLYRPVRRLPRRRARPTATRARASSAALRARPDGDADRPADGPAETTRRGPRRGGPGRLSRRARARDELMFMLFVYSD